MSVPEISVVLPTRNPHPDRLAEVLAGLRRQNLPADRWEFCLVDNGSSPPLQAAVLSAGFPFRVVSEPRVGLLWARLHGVQATRGKYVVFIDDDTVPDHDFLSAAVAFMDAHPRVGTAGGKISARFEHSPPAWLGSVAWCLALRDSGAMPLEWSANDGPLPSWTPIGAGLVARRAALLPDYERHVAAHWPDIERISWHGQGAGGVEDKDLVLHTLRSGWSTGYAPAMKLTHIIPEDRLQLAYFEKILPALEEMWVQTLHAHGFETRAPIHPATRLLRQLKSWLIFRAWRSPEHRLQWIKSCGHLKGLARNHRHPVRYATTTPSR